jgi:hypothetical protein
MVAIVLFSISVGTRIYINKTNMKAAVLPAVLIDLTNEARLVSGQRILARSSLLDQAAQLKANDMATNNYFAHVSPSGLSPWYWFSRVNYVFSYAGENLAVDFSESVDVKNAWLLSPTHKANILSSNFTEIGIAVAEGYRHGKPTVYVVQMFGKPLFSNPINSVFADKKEEVQDIPTTTDTKAVLKLEPKVAVADSTVKGETFSLEQEIETILETPELILVKDVSVSEDQTLEEEKTIVWQEENFPRYSTWCQRFLFLTPVYTDLLYRIFIYIVLLALILMMVIEIKKQHFKNIIYGLLILIIIFCLIYLNKAIFLPFFS